MKDHITLDNIAKKTGVSRATVHRALHGKPGVSPTVEKAKMGLMFS